MKNYVIYTGILIIGLLLGWLFFGGNESHNEGHHDETSQANSLWTCSMHPQIMKQEAGDCPICGMDLIPAEASADGLKPDQFKLTENAMALANIQTSTVTNNAIAGNTIKLSGKITENEDATATQPAHFDGRIEKLYVNSVGERVKMGQAVAEVYSPEIVAAQQELITAYRMRESQPELYKAVRNKFRNWEIHPSELSKIEKSGQVKTNFTIHAHVSGIVSEIAVSQGAHIMDGHPIFKVENLNTVWANFDVYENQIRQFKKGQDIVITTNSYPNKAYTAKVTFIDPVLNAETRTVKLRAVLNNTNGMLKPGMFVEGTIEGMNADEEQLVIIPSTAVLWTGKRSVVYVKPNPKEAIFEMRVVVLGNRIGENYQVLEGLKHGDELVTNGTFTVDAAAQLQGKKSMMNTKMSELEEPINAPEKFQNQLKKVYNHYVNLKDALVKDAVKTVNAHANKMLNSMNDVNMKLLTDGHAHTKWGALKRDIKTAAGSISKTSDIEQLRTSFKTLSSELTKAVKVFGVNEKVFIQFCPMADNDNGAFWLSKEKKIVNPYFGGGMLSCGSVEETIEE